MLSAAQDPLAAQAVIKGACETNHLLDALPIATSAEGIVRIVIERNVEHRAEVEVEPEKTKQPAGDLAMLPDKGNVVAIAELLRIRRLVPDQPQPGNATALLVDRDDRFDFADIAQIVDQFPKLRRALNVAPEKDEAARLDAAKERRRF